VKKVSYIPGGKAEGAYFQQYCNVRKINALDAIPADPNPGGKETPEAITVATSLRLDSAVLRRILMEGE
jgi:hypothetical protein